MYNKHNNQLWNNEWNSPRLQFPHITEGVVSSYSSALYSAGTVKVKSNLEQAMKAQKWNRGTALLQKKKIIFHQNNAPAHKSVLSMGKLTL